MFFCNIEPHAKLSSCSPRRYSLQNYYTSFGYDPVNRLTSAQGFAEGYIWQHDGNSNRTSEQQGANIDTYSYATQTNRLLEVNGVGSSQFAYDGAGNMTNNGNIAYSYNARGQLSAVNNGTGTIANYQYNGFNQRVLKVVDGQERIFVYDTDGMLLSEHDSSGKPLVQYVNFEGQVLAASTVAQSSASNPSCEGITARVSDHLGALRVYVTTELINGIVTASYRAHGSHDRLGSDALATVTLYANGFNYWQVTDPGNCASPTVGACPATTSTNQEHTSQQRAYAQTATVWWWLPATTTYYAQGSNDNLGTSGTTVTTLYQGANGSWHKSDPANCPLEQTAGWLYYHNDHLGTPQKVTDAEGEVVWEATVNPFGDVIETVTDFEQNIRFPGQYHDRETGLYYNWHRYYPPELGRYITSDPIGLAGGMNTYGYVGGNPVMFIDPMGLENLNLHSPSGSSLLYRFASDYPDTPGNCVIFAHGNKDLIRDDRSSFPGILMTTNDIVTMLKEEFPENTCKTIELRSCLSGKGENSIAQKISNQLPGISVTGANGYYAPLPNDPNRVTYDWLFLFRKRNGAWRTFQGD